MGKINRHNQREKQKMKDCLHRPINEILNEVNILNNDVEGILNRLISRDNSTVGAAAVNVNTAIQLIDAIYKKKYEDDAMTKRDST